MSRKRARSPKPLTQRKCAACAADLKQMWRDPELLFSTVPLDVLTVLSPFMGARRAGVVDVKANLRARRLPLPENCSTVRVDDSGHYWLASWERSKVYILSQSGDVLHTIAGDALTQPLDLHIDANGEAVVIDNIGFKRFRYPQDRDPSVYPWGVTSSGFVSYGDSFCIGADGNYIMACGQTLAVVKPDSNAGAQIAKIGHPITSVATLSNGDIVVNSWTLDELLILDATGARKRSIGRGVFWSPIRFAVDAADTIVVLDNRCPSELVYLSPEGAVLGKPSCDYMTNTSISAIEIDREGRVLMVCNGRPQLVVYEPEPTDKEKK